jgi:signal transduction histidine kinase
MVEASVIDGIETVLTIYHNQIKSGIEVSKSYSTVPLILCHPDELTQVWSNLISNAIQAMNYQGRLEIAVFEQENHLVVEIVDFGCGIPAEIQQKIFEPFFTTKPIGEGSGLGLNIVHKIVDRHHGKVEVISQPGHTKFRVKLPI